MDSLKLLLLLASTKRKTPVEALFMIAVCALGTAQRQKLTAQLMNLAGLVDLAAVFKPDDDRLDEANQWLGSALEILRSAK